MSTKKYLFFQIDIFLKSKTHYMIIVRQYILESQRAGDLHSRSRVRVKACTSCKSLEQPEFYSLTWAHKVRFLEGEVSLNPKKKYWRAYHMLEWTLIVTMYPYILKMNKKKIYLRFFSSWLYFCEIF